MIGQGQGQWDAWLGKLHDGIPITPTASEWHGGLRQAVQEYAAHMVDGGQDIYAVIALHQVQRVDAIHGSCPVVSS